MIKQTVCVKSDNLFWNSSGLLFVCLLVCLLFLFYFVLFCFVFVFVFFSFFSTLATEKVTFRVFPMKNVGTSCGIPVFLGVRLILK